MHSKPPASGDQYPWRQAESPQKFLPSPCPGTLAKTYAIENAYRDNLTNIKRSVWAALRIEFWDPTMRARMTLYDTCTRNDSFP